MRSSLRTSEQHFGGLPALCGLQGQAKETYLLPPALQHPPPAARSQVAGRKGRVLTPPYTIPPTSVSDAHAPSAQMAQSLGPLTVLFTHRGRATQVSPAGALTPAWSEQCLDLQGAWGAHTVVASKWFPCAIRVCIVLLTGDTFFCI